MAPRGLVRALAALTAAAAAAATAAPPDPYNCAGLAAQGAFTPYELSNGDGLTLRFIPYGATVTNIFVRGRDGAFRDVVLGFDDPTQYCNATQEHPYFGALIGRVANRIANGTFTLTQASGPVTYNTPINEPANNDTLHGGTIGYDRRLWSVQQVDAMTAVLTLDSPDGEMGFPGDVSVQVTYSVSNDNTWEIDYKATSNTLNTVVSLTQHTYFNLNGCAAGIVEHTLSMPTATQYVVVDEHLIPTGDVEPVTPVLDFTKTKVIGKDIANGTVTPTGGYDNAWVFSNWQPSSPSVVPQVTAYSPLSGIQMVLSTDQPSVQFYSGNFLDSTIPKKADQGPGTYDRWMAIALEAQHYPDSVHHPNFPSIVLQKGQTYAQTTRYAFSIAP
jgi:aldose 1-epimerase